MLIKLFSSYFVWVLRKTTLQTNKLLVSTIKSQHDNLYWRSPTKIVIFNSDELINSNSGVHNINSYLNVRINLRSY